MRICASLGKETVQTFSDKDGVVCTDIVSRHCILTDKTDFSLAYTFIDAKCSDVVVPF